MSGPAIASPTVNRGPLHPAIDDTLIRRLVDTFYAKVRRDAVLGPIFDTAIGDRWDEHLPKMYDFWSSIMCMTGRYKGKPVPAHARHKTIRAEHFETWLGLFRETAHEVCEPEVAAMFVTRAERIAESLKLALFFDPAATAAFGRKPQ